MSKAAFETRMQDMPTCPHCGHRHQDAWEWNFGPGMEGDREGETCESCEESFDCRRDVSVYYTTTPAAQADGYRLQIK